MEKIQLKDGKVIKKSDIVSMDPDKGFIELKNGNKIKLDSSYFKRIKEKRNADLKSIDNMIPNEVIDTEFDEFIKSGEVPQSRIDSIVNKIKTGDKLSKEDLAIQQGEKTKKLINKGLGMKVDKLKESLINKQSEQKIIDAEKLQSTKEQAKTEMYSKKQEPEVPKVEVETPESIEKKAEVKAASNKVDEVIGTNKPNTTPTTKATEKSFINKLKSLVGMDNIDEAKKISIIDSFLKKNPTVAKVLDSKIVKYIGEPIKGATKIGGKLVSTPAIMVYGAVRDNKSLANADFSGNAIKDLGQLVKIGAEGVVQGGSYFGGSLLDLGSLALDGVKYAVSSDEDRKNMTIGDNFLSDISGTLKEGRKQFGDLLNPNTKNETLGEQYVDPIWDSMFGDDTEEEVKKDTKDNIENKDTKVDVVSKKETEKYADREILKNKDGTYSYISKLDGKEKGGFSSIKEAKDSIDTGVTGFKNYKDTQIIEQLSNAVKESGITDKEKIKAFKKEQLDKLKNNETLKSKGFKDIDFDNIIG